MAKARSRNFPALGLGDAIKKAKEFYSKDGKAAVPSDVAVQAWGYKGINGASLRTLGAVRQYGLLDGSGDKMVKLSARGLTIVLEPEDSAERATAISEAAMMPAMFKELRDQYPDGLPSDAAMVSWLVRSHSFNEGSARDLIASYRATLALAGEGVKRDTSAGHSRGDHSEGERNNPPPPPRGHQGRPPAPEAQHMEFTWPLSGDAVATLTVSKGLDPDDIETLTAYFEIAKKALGKAAKATANANLERLLTGDGQTGDGEG